MGAQFEDLLQIANVRAAAIVMPVEVTRTDVGVCVSPKLWTLRANKFRWMDAAGAGRVVFTQRESAWRLQFRVQPSAELTQASGTPAIATGCPG
jgi:hypothetical protein